ncbi:hypothetical protein GOP47_0007377 [Adiantum capillus-veneris]|uniref:U3 small nucleolar RNA-associated protein 15 C-terminal domain-containing protein n=1 Tax=Adiantum capillus-veneris TaxID=13818 RepID=A0A9D4V1F9_ADICA|nr:hypothetical protein GOP47_0007377 [Adiantum capillus-veneris]
MEGQSSSYKPVRPKKFAASRKPSAAESKYWKSFSSKLIEQQIAAVTCINFCPEPPHDFAVTSSTRVSVYDGQTCKVKKTISRFSDVAYSGVFRPDGQLVVAGGEMGVIQVFDLNSRLVLRQLKGHSRAVHWVRYSPSDKLQVLSGSDDTTVRWWDVPTESEVLRLEGHADYVRSGSANPSSGDVWATGSYDHTVNLWDLRTSNVVLKLQHGKPLEDVLFFPSGGLLATAGGNVVKIWDILGGGRLLHALGSHQKTVTSLCITPPIRVNSNDLVTSKRLLTGSLDGHVRVFDISDFKVVHASKYDSPIMSMDLSQSMSTMAVGTSEGKLFIRQKKKVAAAEGANKKSISNVIYEEPKIETVLRPSNYRYFLRGRSEKATEEDFYVAQQRRLKLAEYDRHLRKFRYKEALVSSLKTFNPTVVLAVMEELICRRGLISAVSNLDTTSLELLLDFLRRNVTLPQYSRILIPFAHKVLDKCAGDFCLSPSILHQVAILRDKVEDEVRLQESLQSLQGLIQPLIQASIRGWVAEETIQVFIKREQKLLQSGVLDLVCHIESLWRRRGRGRVIKLSF